MDTSVRGLRDHPYADRTVRGLLAKMGQRLGDAPYIADNHTGPCPSAGSLSASAAQPPGSPS